MTVRPRLPDFVKAVIGSEDLQEEAVSCLNSPQDAFALAAHAYFVAKGFRLEGVNHEKLGTPASSTMHSVHNHSSTINHSPNANQTSLHQTNWLRQSPNYFHFNYSSNIPTTGDWSYDEDQARFKTSLDVTISKLSQRMVQVSVSGEVEDTSKDNDSDPESQTLDAPNSVKEFPLTTVQATLNEVVNTSFFSNQPRESEDIADVYTSIEAVDGLWGTLNKSVWNKIKQLTDDAPTNSGSISQEESSENSAVVTKTQEEDPLKESERKKTDLRESDPRGHRSASLAEPYAAADSSPSPAAHGAGTPSTPYGTPPPFTHTSQLRKLDSKLSSRRKSIEQQDIDMATKHEEDDSEAKGVKQHNVVSTDDSAKASKRYSDTPGVPVMPQHDPPLPLGGNTDAPRRPLAPTGDVPPGFEDEYEIQSSLRDPTVTGYGARPGFGDRDLYPPGMGPHPTLDPLGRPGLGPFPGSGGMHPTAGDLERMMGGRGRLRDDDDDEMNYFGGTRGPPGSRFDPTGPFGGPNSGFGSRGGNSRFGGGFL